MKKEITINEKVVIITVDLDTPKREHGGGYSRSMTAERFIEFKAEEDGQEIAIKYYPVHKDPASCYKDFVGGLKAEVPVDPNVQALADLGFE